MATSKILLFVALLAGASSDLLGPEGDSQELFVYRQRNYAVHQLLKSRCPELSRMKRESVDDASLPIALSAEKIVYNRLLNSLVKCTSKTSNKHPTSPTTSRMLTSTTDQPLPQDCQEINDRGIVTPGEYLIHPSAYKMGPFKVWCDFFDGHGWTVFQKRFDGSVNFTLGWKAYKDGFGDVTGEHWLGLDKLHAITRTNKGLNILLTAANGTTLYGDWPSFSVSDEREFYTLNINGDGYRGSLDGSALSAHNRARFSTPDRDIDNFLEYHCASGWEGGWWFDKCHSCLLNGVYGASEWGGIVWGSTANHFTESVMRVSRF